MAPRTIFQRGRPNGSGTAGRRAPSTVKPAIVAICSVEISERGRELPISGIDPKPSVSFLQTGQSARSRFCELDCSEAALCDLNLPAINCHWSGAPMSGP